MKRKVEIQAVLMLVFTLVAVWVLLSQMLKNVPGKVENIPVLSEYENAGIVDTTFVDYRFYFLISAPTRSWKISKVGESGIKDDDSSKQKIMDNIQWLVNLEHEAFVGTDALSKVGIIHFADKIDSKDLTISILNEIMQKYETGKNVKNRIRVVTPTTGPAHRLMQGHYFVIVLPDKAASSFPVWIYSVLPRKDKAYIIVSKTTEEKYTSLKDDLKKIVSSFRPISYSIER